MTTATKTSNPRSKPERFVAVIHREAHGIVIQLTYQTARTEKVSFYTICPIPGCMYGAGYEVEKEDGATYHVNLNSRESTCECRGHLAHGHRTICKHIAFLMALAQRGELPLLPHIERAEVSFGPTEPVIPDPF